LGVKRRGVKLTIHLHLVLRSRMRGTLSPLPQNAFMAWCSVRKKHKEYFNFYLILQLFSRNRSLMCVL